MAWQRHKLVIEYDGTPYAGWQIQPDIATVQGNLKKALSTLLGAMMRKASAPGEIDIVAAGRTDSGVHAQGQVAHVDFPLLDSEKLKQALNYHLKGEAIAILSAEPAPPHFHARFSATKRHYLYRILNRRAPAILERERVWHVARPLDVDAMRRGAQYLIGQHDFSSFRAARCQASSPIKTLDKLDIEVSGSDEVHFRLASRSFLHNQVRAMVGTLHDVGIGKFPPGHVKNILMDKNRCNAGQNAVPYGLYLIQVDYQCDASMPSNDTLYDRTADR